MAPSEYYLESNGRILSEDADRPLQLPAQVYVRPRILGGKGGFGSMLRAIGAQIEKTTNREACRDLSGRRLRDINEEKRVKAWLDKQSEQAHEAKDKKKRKIENLLQMPKHEFKDAQYEEARSKLEEKVHSAVEKGFMKSLDAASTSSSRAVGSSLMGSNTLKRKGSATNNGSVKKAKTKKCLALWIDDDLSGSSDSELESGNGGSESEQLDNETDDSNNSTTPDGGSKDSTSQEMSKDSTSQENSKDSSHQENSKDLSGQENSKDSSGHGDSTDSQSDIPLIQDTQKKDFEQKQIVKA